MNANYYAVIPGNVRYDKDLTPNAKLLYGEITALCNEKGYCWATNSYFSELYGVSKTSISKWIKQLIDKGYLSSEIKYKGGTKEIESRYLTIINDPIKEKLNTPIEEKLKDNNTSFNNTINNSIYTIFDFWNEQKIVVHRKSNNKIKTRIKNILEDYSESDLKEAITNYKTILTSDDYFWSYKWGLLEFLKPDTIDKFLTENDPFSNYRNKSKKNINKESNVKAARI